MSQNQDVHKKRNLGVPKLGAIPAALTLVTGNRLRRVRTQGSEEGSSNYTIYAAEGRWHAGRRGRPIRVPVGDAHIVLDRETRAICGTSINGLEPFPRVWLDQPDLSVCPMCEHELRDPDAAG